MKIGSRVYSNNAKNLGIRYFLKKTVSLIVCVFIFLLSSGISESVHSLAHLLQGKHCAEADSLGHHDVAVVDIVQPMNICSIKSALVKYFSNTLLVTQMQIAQHIYFEENLLAFAERPGFPFAFDSLWHPPRGPPALV